MIQNKKKKQHNGFSNFISKVISPYTTDLVESLKRNVEKQCKRTISSSLQYFQYFQTKHNPIFRKRYRTRQQMSSMGVRRNFSRGGGNVAKLCCPFQFADDANRRSQNALPLLHHKKRVPCYDSSHKNAFVGSSQARESEICFQRGANQSRISRPPYPNCGARCHKGPKFTAVATEGLLWA